MKKAISFLAKAQLALLLLALTTQITARQQPDPNFNAKVGSPAYLKRHPKVLFDEAHLNSHTAGGTYKPFVDLIASDGYKVAPNKQRFSKESLKGYDILVIANARGPQGQTDASAFTEQECDAVRDWVRAGGSLLLIIKHSPFGAAAAELAKRFDVSIGAGHAIDKTNYNKEAEDQTELVFTRENELLADHPITSGRGAAERINRVITFSGTSIKGPDGSVAFLRLSDTAFDVVRPDQQPVSADSAPPDYKLIPAAGRAQAVALEAVKGRVVVFAEAAALTAQIGSKELRYGMNMSGIDNRQLALNVMHWLSKLLK